MDKKSTLILSPHPDDVAYSLGASVSMWSQTRTINVWNVFSKQEYTVLNMSSEQAQEQIIREEKEVALSLQYEPEFCDVPEAGLRGYKRLRDIFGGTEALRGNKQDKITFQLVQEKLSSAIERLNPEILFAPIGVLHVDHILLNYATMQVWEHVKEKGIQLFLYEDLPYCIDEQAKMNALNIWSTYTLRPHIIISNFLDKKDEILSIYKSQNKRRDIAKVIQYGKTVALPIGERIWEVCKKDVESEPSK
jgi:LmbE family N-acetylglucosaminyl deacetylase